MEDMRNGKVEKIEDIYPLTIVSTRYNGKIVIGNFEVDSGEGDDRLCMSWANYIQGSEEVSYRLHEWMEEFIAPCVYGIGPTLEEAFDDYKKRCTQD